jgi:hypothetical protein
MDSLVWINGLALVIFPLYNFFKNRKESRNYGEYQEFKYLRENSCEEHFKDVCENSPQAYKRYIKYKKSKKDKKSRLSCHMWRQGIGLAIMVMIALYTWFDAHYTWEIHSKIKLENLTSC